MRFARNEAFKSFPGFPAGGVCYVCVRVQGGVWYFV